jgi:hypothetical protein
MSSGVIDRNMAWYPRDSFEDETMAVDILMFDLMPLAHVTLHGSILHVTVFQEFVIYHRPGEATDILLLLSPEDIF